MRTPKIEKLPDRYVHTCDGCKTQVETGGTGHPPYWLTVSLTGYIEGQDPRFADHSTQGYYCQECGMAIRKGMSDGLGRKLMGGE